MFVLGFDAENVKRLKVVHLEFKGPGVVEIAGDNGNGKTSVLDALEWGLQGKRADVQWMPVRKGQEKATIRLSLGDDTGVDYIITRTFTLNTEGAKVTHAYRVEDARKGHKLASPQTLLDTFLGATSLDPIAFLRMKPGERLGIVKRLVPGIDFDALAEERENAYATRRDVNRDAERAFAAIAGVSIPDDTPDEPIDTEPLFEAVNTATDRTTQIERARTERLRKQDEIDDWTQTAKENREQAAQLVKEAVRMESEAAAQTAALAKLKPLPEAPDTTELADAIRKAEAINRMVGMKSHYKEGQKAALALKARSEALTKRMDEIDATVAEAVAKAKLPVKGLSIGEGDVYLDGVPFDQGSDAQQLRASIALAMADKPELRVIRIRDGSLLDKKAMAILSEVATKAKFQIWIERVDPSSPAAIVMEDGEVANG